jgi:hypothetical protein
VPNVTLTLTGSASSSTLSSGSGTYQFTSLAAGGSYTVTPSKARLTPGSTGIDTFDVLAAQLHYLNTVVIPPGCRRDAADVSGDGLIDTFDVIAIQRFFIGRPTGFFNVGKYRFTPAVRSYTPLNNSVTGQDYDTLIFGDIVGGFVHRPEGPSQDAAGEGEVPATVAAVSLPNGAVDAAVTNFIAQVTTTAIDATNKLIGFQGDFTFDERVVTFQGEPVQKAGLTAGNWNVSGNVLPAEPGAGPIRTLRISGYSLDFTPLSGSGTLFDLRMTRVSKTAQGTQLLWAAPPNQFIFIDTDLKAQKPGYSASGGVKSSGEAPAPPKAAPTRTIAPLDVIDPSGTEGDSESFREQGEATIAEGSGVLFALFQRTMPREPWQRIRLE